MGTPTSGTLFFRVCLIASTTIYTALIMYRFFVAAIKHLVMVSIKRLWID